MTVEEFLAWEDRQDLKHEFDGTRPVAMAGGTLAHSALQSNVAAAMVTRLRGKPCRFFTSDLKVEVSGRIRYPDGFVACLPLLPDTKVVRDPVVIFEILSDSSGSTDLVTKNHEYASTPSVDRYIVLAQDRIGGTMFARLGGDWIGRLLGPGAVIDMPEIGITVPLADFYEGLTFPPEAPAGL